MTFKDFLVPIGTAVGAAAGVGGILGAARVNARSLERKAEKEFVQAQEQGRKDREREALDTLSRFLKEAFEEQIKIAQLSAPSWDSDEGRRGRIALQLKLAQLLAQSQELDRADLERVVQRYLVPANDIAHATGADIASSLATASADAYGQALKEIAAKRREVGRDLGIADPAA